MAAIYLVRHGQAGFGKANYDELSSLGHQQAALIGQALSTRHIDTPYIVHGAMQRHLETLEGAQTHWKNSAQATSMQGFNEFDSDDIIACAYPEFNNKAALAAWIMQQDNKRKAFQELFAKTVERWTSGKYDNDYLESWTFFQNRVQQAFIDVLTQAAHRDVVIFTSGGPITVIAQQCLALSNNKAFELNWTLLNGGITQVLYSRTGKISLASFNEHQHLAQAGANFLTYR